MPPTPTLIIAEAGVNHNGSLDLALELVDVAAAAHADVIKFQTFKSDQVVSRTAPKAEYQYKGTPASESQLEMARRLELDEAAHRSLVKRCEQRGVEFMASPFDLASVEFLARSLDVRRLKIGSGEITNFPLLLRAARTRKPILLSTGMSCLGEVEAALRVLAFGLVSDERPRNTEQLDEIASSVEARRALREKVTLLHCTTEYPAPFEDVNLRAIDTLRAAFFLSTGLSDHTPGVAIPVAAVARGATVIEKHFTLNRQLPGPDQTSSLEPDGLALMVRSIREVEAAMGDGVKIAAPSERRNIPIARKSLVAARRVSQGEAFTEQNLTTKRPGSGVSARYYWEYLGAVAPRTYEEDELIDSFLGPGRL